jgi:glycosyltransferase involved in cell wall biosynthesis
MRILTYTTLYPNQLQPNHGIFIKQRMMHFAQFPGHELQVVAPIPYCPKWLKIQPWNINSRIQKLEYQNNIPVYHPKYPLIPKISMHLHAVSLFLASIQTLKVINKTFPFDLIDGHYIYPDGLAAVWLGKAFKKPVVLSARGSDINQFAGFRTIRPMIQRALCRAKGIISVCEALKKEMVELGVSEKKILVIANGVDTEKFYIKDKKKVRASFGIPVSNKVILSVGSLIPRKGFHHLIAAMPEVLDKQPGTLLYILGEGPFRSELEQLIQDLHLSGSVFLVGERPHEELINWYNSADAFCLASSREGWANVLMEALACGCPVVATNVYGAPEIVTSDEVGTLVAENPGSIAQALIGVLSSEWSKERIRQHVVTRDWSAVASEVKKCFEGVLK